jgi:hypothetical protein
MSSSKGGKKSSNAGVPIIGITRGNILDPMSKKYSYPMSNVGYVVSTSGIAKLTSEVKGARDRPNELNHP